MYAHVLQVFASEPLRVFEGHKSDIVDFSWSHSDFLCSASIDHTVMLWHPVRWARVCVVVPCCADFCVRMVAAPLSSPCALGMVYLLAERKIS